MHIDPPLYAKGHNGQLSFDGEFVTITRDGWVARSAFGRSEKRLHVSQISAVQWKGSGLTLGYIEFTLSGGRERHSRMARQAQDNAKNENAVIVTKKTEPAFLAIRTAVEQAIAEQHQAPAASPAAAPPAPANDMASQFRQLAELHAAGVLTDDEFTAAKGRLLG
ncbi:DUF4429 domain-containing protein [Embleya sp. NPDC050154]|uniref:DUF4429 domain-containing protein n=1 Tax=Embleya sp. NPDC050154 TaxID=3363988 RepID=UPI0037A6C414